MIRRQARRNSVGLECRDQEWGFGVFSSLAITSSATSLGDPMRSPWMKSSVSAGAQQQCPGSSW